MTPDQAEFLALIKTLNAEHFDGWFQPSYVMAFVQIESSFKPHSYRYEKRLGEASYGLMQVLASTARTMGLYGDPQQMFDPECGLLYGMKTARAYWEQLQAKIAREPTLEEWAVSYNAGVNGEARHIKTGDEDYDAAYANAWDNAQEYWEGYMAVYG